MKFTAIVIAAVCLAGEAFAKPYLGNSVGITKRVRRSVQKEGSRVDSSLGSNPAGGPISFVCLHQLQVGYLRLRESMRLQLRHSPYARRELRLVRRLLP